MTDKRQPELTTATELDATDTVLGFRTSDEEDVRVPLSVLDTRFAADPAALAADVAFSTTFQGLDTDLTAIAGAGNGDVLVLIQDAPPTTADVTDLVASALTQRTSGVVEAVVGAVELDMAVADSFLVSSTAGNYTLNPINYRATGVDVLYVTIYTTTTGHTMTFGPSHRYVGLKPTENAWTAGQKRTFRFTHIPNTDEWIGEELSAQLGLNTVTVEMDDATAPVPAGNPTAFTPAVYRFDSGTYVTGGIQADETIVGIGATSADEMAYLAVVDVADGNAYEPAVSGVRWFVDPVTTTFSTWATNTPTIGDNGYAAASTVAPWKFEFDSRFDPTGLGTPSWAADGDHDIYAQVLFTDASVVSVKVDLAVDNNTVAVVPPGAPTSVVATAGTNSVALTWVAPVVSESGGATPATGTDPATWTQAYASITVPMPQATATGDTVLLFVQVSNASSSPTITVPVGYVQIGTVQGGTSPVSRWQAVYRLTASGVTADAAVSVTAANVFGYAIVVTNVNATTPLDVAVVEGANSTPAGATTATNNAIVVQGVLTDQVNALALATANGFTLEAGGASFDSTRGSGGAYAGSSVACASKLQATAGAVTAPVYDQTVGTSTSYRAWHTITLRPAATGGTSTATGYEVRSGTTSPPSGTPVNVGSVLAYTVGGLAPSVLRYAQVRAYDTLAQRGPWSSVVSATPTGSGVITDYGKTLDGWTMASNGTNQNFIPFRTALNSSGVYLPLSALRTNLLKTKPPAPVAINTEIGKALSRYTTVKNSVKKFIGTDPGPRLQFTSALSFTGTSSRVNADNRHITTLLDLAKTARGDFNTAFVAGAQAIKDNTSGGYDWVLQTAICPAHEANGQWYASSFAVQSELVGVAVLSGATNAEWGTDVGAALRQVAVDGDRGPVWALAWEQMYNSYISVDPRFWFCLNLSAGSANPDGLPSGDTGWNTNAIDDIGGMFHSIDLDIYCRGGGIPDYDGSGSLDLTSNWTFTNTDTTLAEADAVAAAYGVPFGFGEVGAQFNLTGYNYTDLPSDQEASVWYRYVFDWYNARETHLGNLWLNVPGAADVKVGTTYLPDPTLHPKSWAVLQEFFPA